MFIDDLQWADVASLKLIKLLMSAPDSQYLFFIGAYRDNEVSTAHPLMLTVDEIREAGVRVERIFLSPLDLSNVNQLISDTLNCSPNKTNLLAELVLSKTGGNPFFLQEFLKALYAENLIKFDFTPSSKNGRSQGTWQWNLEQIKAQGITDNVVELMASKIQKLSASTQRVLQLAAAIGNQFDLETLAIVYEKSQRETAAELQEAIAINLILPLSDAHKLIELDIVGNSSLEINQPTTIEYKFAHDRIQQAAYSLIPPEDKQAVHWKIGQLLLQNTSQQLREQKIFDVVNQLNFGIELITAPSERDFLAQLNLIAGKKAKVSAAYESAWNYLKLGINCLSADSWQNQYDLTLALYVEAAEAASLSGNFEEMERLASVVLQQGKTLLDKVKVYEVKIQDYTAHNKPLEAVKTALSVLTMLGIRFPKKPNKLDIIFGLMRTKIRLAGKQIEDLIGAENKCRLIGESYDEIKMLPIHLEANTKNICHSLYFFKLYLGYLFQDYQQALENAALVEENIDNAIGAFPLSHFYNSLVHLAIYFDVSKFEQKRILEKVESNQKKIKKWASSAPMNHLNKFYLVEAERYRVLGHKDKATDCYDRAIELAKEHEYINDEALAHELAAKFYLALGKAKIAQVYMLDARHCYRQWGAVAKVKDLEARYPQLLSRKSDSKVTSQSRVTESGSESSEVLDLASVMKASQVISGEMMLDKLLAKLMKILIENAGAQKGFLILEQAGKLLIEAEGAAKEDSITVLQSVPIESVGVYGSTGLLSSAIINYVARTKESVVLNDATREGQFTKDSYITQNQPKSILCVPLINQDKLISIVYLENNLAAGAFTPDRLEVIKLLSAQAAIAIANAKLYSEVKESESKLTQFNEASSRFVPSQFLQFLEKESIVDIKLGDSVQKEMSVLFSDIRDFTTLSESMTPEDNFKFINAYLSRMEPAIVAHQGFIDKYIGDAIMALFGSNADDALLAGIAMLHRLAEYNQHRANSGYMPIQIGIGINTGSLMLGTVGGQNRMDSTVISDAVNLASRLEGLTKKYGVSLLISHHTFAQLEDVNQYVFRIIDRVQVKGKSTEVSVYEVFDADPPKLREGKLITKTVFEEALLHYNRHSFTYAERLFEEVLRLNPEDRAAQIYLERCQSIKPMDINNFKLDKFVQLKNTKDAVDDVVPVFPAQLPQ
jgi:class 3 adenylate cyclase/GAF domain-containing protein